jgi:hypothetical protein
MVAFAPVFDQSDRWMHGGSFEFSLLIRRHTLFMMAPYQFQHVLNL